MTFLNSSNDGLLDVDTMMETTLLHMMILLDDSMLLLDDILYDVEDANADALLLVDHCDATHDVGHDPNKHGLMAHKAILPLNILHDDPILLMMNPQSILDEAVQKMLYTI